LATYSTVLGLKLNDESDPFELSDFTSNYGILDASPGVYICTSTSRPSWGAAQNGRLIFMQDLKQLSYWEASGGWHDLRDAAPVFAGGVFLNTTANPGSSGVFSVLNLYTPRPCSLAIWLSGTYNYPNNKFQNANQLVAFDGVPGNMGGYPEQIRFAGDSSDSGTDAGITCLSMQIIPSVSAGQHTIGAQVQVGSDYHVSVKVVGFKVLAMLSLFGAGNSL
jgi:hypothetical protein